MMVIDNNDSRTFRPVAIMVVGKEEINASGSYPISHQYCNTLYRSRSEIINSPSDANNSLKRNPLLLIDLLGLSGHSEEYGMPLIYIDKSL